MYVSCDSNSKGHEIEIADSAEGMNQLGKLLLNIDKNLKIYTKKEKLGSYPEALEDILIRFLEEDNWQQLDLLKIFIEDKNLVIEGRKSAVDILGVSLTNFFNEDAKKYDHFHLDYWEGNGLLAPTNCSLIFMCLGQDN